MLGLAAGGLAVAGWHRARANASIASLETGEDVAVGTDAAPALLVARLQYLAIRGRLDEAEPLMAALDAGPDTAAIARGHYLVGNARVRAAFDLIGRGSLDKAGPQVTLARQDYRRALRERPDFWDAKFNLDVAARLIRDFPEFDRTGGDELRSEPKAIWTDIPGQPRGGP